jgi:alpha-aminoadipate carrier protein LysW
MESSSGEHSSGGPIRAQKIVGHSSPPLTNRRGESKYYQEALIGKGGLMVLCPECESNLDVEEEEVDEGEVISCPECGTDFEVVTTSPLELKAVEEGYEEDEDEEEEETEDGDYS